MKWLLLFSLLFGCACKELKYESDIGVTLDSGSAEYPNFPAKVLNKVCKNSDGELGSCMINLFEGRDLDIVFPKRPYGYKLDVVCSSRIDYTRFFNVGVEQEFKVIIPKENFNNLPENQSYFLCTFVVIPKDERKAVSALTRLFVNVYKEGFRLPDTQAGKVFECEKGDGCKGRWMYLGINTMYSLYGDKYYKKKPYVKYKGQKTYLGETAAMRFMERWYE